MANKGKVTRTLSYPYTIYAYMIHTNELAEQERGPVLVPAGTDIEVIVKVTTEPTWGGVKQQVRVKCTLHLPGGEVLHTTRYSQPFFPAPPGDFVYALPVALNTPADWEGACLLTVFLLVYPGTSEAADPVGGYLLHKQPGSAEDRPGRRPAEA